MAARKKTATRKAVKAAQEAKRDICFTIMPFGGWFDTYYESIYCPAIEAAGLDPKRADDLMRPSTIVHDIWAYTCDAKIILADLTGQNPNVFYELGLAHAVAKPAILLTESLSDVPFDLRALRVIEFSKSAPDWGAELKEQIEQSLKEVLQSPLESVLPAFLNVRDGTKKPVVAEHEKELIEIRQDIERLRREVARRPFDSVRHSSRLPAREIEARVRKYLMDGMPPHHIVELVERRYGVRGRWVLALLKDLSEQMKLPLEVSGATRKESDSDHAA